MSPGERVADLIRSHRLGFTTEDGLQQACEAILAAAGLEPAREVRLRGETGMKRGRIDLLVGRVGVECKIAGSGEAVLRQLTAYARCPAVEELVLVTRRAVHRGMPKLVAGVPLHVVGTWANL